MKAVRDTLLPLCTNSGQLTTVGSGGSNKMICTQAYNYNSIYCKLALTFNSKNPLTSASIIG